MMTETPTGNHTLEFHGTHLKDYWSILIRRKWIVFSFCTAATVAVAVLSFMMTPLYEASTTIVIEREDSGLSPDASQKGVSFDLFENYLETQRSLILSLSIAGKVFNDLHLGNTARYQEETNTVKRVYRDLKKSVLGWFGLAARIAEKPDPLMLFLKDIRVERVKGTRAMRIAVMNTEPQMAADIANALAERYSRDSLMRRALTFIRNQRMSQLNQDYLRLQSQYDYLSNLYGPKHYELANLKNEIRALSRRIEEERAKSLAQIAKETALEGTASKEEEERMLEEILRKIQETSVLSSEQMNNIVVADPAVPPTQVAVPKKRLNILIGFLAGLVVGIFLAFFVDYLDDTVKSEDDVKRILGNGYLLGSIPFDKYVRGFSKLAKLDHLIVQRPLSESAEAYRMIRIQIHWLSQKDPEFKDFALVSSVPDEGKTTIASNLAIALTQLDKKILLVDTDIRRGRLNRSYGADQHKGLGQFLTEHLPFNRIVQRTKISNLWIVTPGESMVLRSELLGSPKMSEFIQEARSYFDMIVYDTPPITLISDTSVLLAQLYGAVLVTRIGVTHARILPKTFAMIRGTNTKFIGAILNSTENTDNKYYHRYYRD